MQNWKTTSIGLTAAVAYLIYKITTHTFDVGDIPIAFGLAGIGGAARDVDKAPTQAQVNEATAIAREKALKES